MALYSDTQEQPLSGLRKPESRLRIMPSLKSCLLTGLMLTLPLSSLSQADTRYSDPTINQSAEQRFYPARQHMQAIGNQNSAHPYAQRMTVSQAVRFMTQATFGPKRSEVIALLNSSPSSWFVEQLELPASQLRPVVDEFAAMANPEVDFDPLYIESTTFGFWRNSIAAQDQLRQRMAFALSELLVVSNGGGEVLTDIPEAVAYYQDLLITHALGNYRDLLDAVTYSPAMGYYLTYMGSEKADPETGSMPDENYARELLQLFTIGLTELNTDGSERLDSSGQAIETYSNQDITGLARVFTGLGLHIQDEDEADEEFWSKPMTLESELHSDNEKSFLGYSIPAGTDGKTSIKLALDHIFSHQNVAPFVGKQLIQRLVTSNPSPAYVSRVASAFNSGLYILPDGQQVGEGLRGDLTATLAAILFDDEAVSTGGVNDGKVREPILRFTHWARAFDVSNVTPEYKWELWETRDTSSLSQHPYRSPSVFNFFRPGYTAPGSYSAQQGLVAPELQLVNASSVTGYINFMTEFLLFEPEWIDVDELQGEYDEEGINLDASQAVVSFIPDYSEEIAIADNIDNLLEYLDLKLTYGTLTENTHAAIKAMLQDIPAEDGGREDRVRIAILLIMTSPDYLVQR